MVELMEKYGKLSFNCSSTLLRVLHKDGGWPPGQTNILSFSQRGNVMSKKSMVNKAGYLLGVVLIAVTFGCSSKSQTVAPAETGDMAPVSSMVESYGDIELPIEMKLIQDRSMAMRTDSFQGGIHVYKGRVQLSSLRDYITIAMRNHKWKLVGEASYRNVILAFTKPNKTCMVVLSEGVGGGFGQTQADLYVTVDVAAASRLNPFGEPVKQ